MPYESISTLTGGFAHDNIAGVPERIDELMSGDTVRLPGGLCREGGKDYFTVNEDSGNVSEHWRFVLFALQIFTLVIDPTPLQYGHFVFVHGIP